MRENTRAVMIATWVGIIVNTLLAIMKGIGGFISGSRALLADALHSTSDIVGSIVILFGVKIAAKPPDKEHPYGHGKAENIASIIVALLLVVVGIEISLSSAKVFFGETPIAPGKLALIILVISLLVKEILFHYKYYLGKKYNSAALIAEAWHHRSDSLSSLAALIGIIAAMVGERYELTYLIYGDAVAGILVSFIVIKVGYDLAKDSSLIMMEKVLDKNEISDYKQTVSEINGILRIDEILARTHGSYVVMDIKVSVDPDLTVKQGHDIAKNVKQYLMKNYKEIADVFVHVNPFLENDDD
ncbi:cation diffusion facilitator family transporter [Virgibacillus sp. MSJ-26]|uniref:cation diffusion facilitator family transporter n=1 Tax=Virgibacillus sp. MSJ-26 TaxID=2841522 RepID=UPI001C0FEAEC|nr:cation diffusion facilitator family transporter [Virgibacillus sp. MSJ-26]MBU5467775.1 cation diffusion facilitator family transporter [Virgibacillus sp. MSJ-26]